VSLSYDEIKKDLVSLCSCDTCGQEVGSTPAIVKASIGKKLYCPVCASVVEVTAMDQEDEAEESEDDYTAEDDTSEDEDEMSEDDTSEDEMSEEVDASDDDESEITDDPEEDEELGDDESEEDSDSEAEEVEASDDDESDDSEEEPEEDDSEEPTSDEDEEEEEPAALNEETIELAPLDAVMASNSPISIIADAADDKGGLTWYLVADKAIVACAEEVNASDSVKPIFNNYNVFKNAFESAMGAENADTNKELAHFGFEKIKATVSVDTATRSFMEAKITEKTKASVESSDEAEKKFAACVSTAALGVRKGVFGVVSPLFTKLVASYKKMGMENPESLVASLIEDAGKEEMTLIFSKAAELMADTPDTLNAKTEMVTSALTAAVAPSAAVDRPSFTVVRDIGSQHQTVASVKTDESTYDVSALTGRLGNRHYNR